MNRITVLIKEALLHLVMMLELPDEWQKKIPKTNLLKPQRERGEDK